MCRATSVFTDKGELRYVKCHQDGDPFCYFHAKVAAGLIEPDVSNRDEHPKLVGIEDEGAAIWKA